MSIIKIVSGGQTGADRGGLDAAIHCGLSHGGWCPKGRRAEDGFVPDCYHLRETATAFYVERTEKNVLDSDATVVFTRGEPGGGSLKTIHFAQQHKKPWLHVDLYQGGRQEQVKRIVAWLEGKVAIEKEEDVARPSLRCVLNVAGSRERDNPGIKKEVFLILAACIAAVNGPA